MNECCVNFTIRSSFGNWFGSERVERSETLTRCLGKVVCVLLGVPLIKDRK